MSVKYSLNEDPKVMILLCCSYSWEIHNAFGYATCHRMNQATNARSFQKPRCLPNRMCSIKRGVEIVLLCLMGII